MYSWVAMLSLRAIDVAGAPHTGIKLAFADLPGDLAAAKPARRTRTTGRAGLRTRAIGETDPIGITANAVTAVVRATLEGRITGVPGRNARCALVIQTDLTRRTATGRATHVGIWAARSVETGIAPRASSPTPADTGVIAAAGVAIGAVGIGATLAAGPTATVLAGGAAGGDRRTVAVATGISHTADR